MRTLVFAAGAMAVSAAASAADHRVTMAGMVYQPSAITAKVGDSILFINDDTTVHAVFVPTKGHAVSLGAQKPGAEVPLPLRQAGGFDVECVNHAAMLLKVTVQK